MNVLFEGKELMEIVVGIELSTLEITNEYKIKVWQDYICAMQLIRNYSILCLCVKMQYKCGINSLTCLN
jgi:hypothetical protein